MSGSSEREKKKPKLNYRTQVFPGEALKETKLRQEAAGTKRDAAE